MGFLTMGSEMELLELGLRECPVQSPGEAGAVVLAVGGLTSFAGPAQKGADCQRLGSHYGCCSFGRGNPRKFHFEKVAVEFRQLCAFQLMQHLRVWLRGY